MNDSSAPAERPARRPRIAQKIAVVVALFCYLAALACGAAVAHFYLQVGGNSPLVASFAAAIVFFLGAGIVLHVMGRADIPDFRVG
ncbi:hypothetical protein QVG61_13470 [Thiohalobacter sp. IOR34]|uniref:hypothetical protein n=1 Tax=Thiohalobacter sp. IOR34 TaxID=3057176 RepID=UPI0025B12258|nr:hypothetical protein [Thiohalobacter sp. IOR34]WJW75480.1 hypothetical protein QVG61_13470 [Thiohalobacter sp. IOR34]